MNLNARFLILATVIVAVIAALTTFDQWLDPNPINKSELVIDIAEKALIAAGMVAIAWVTFQARDVRAEQVEDLVIHTKKALNAGLKVIKNGCRAGDIGFAIEKYIERFGYGIVRDLVGHGVGHQVHEDPNIPNFGKKGTGDKLISGMTIAVEPMITAGNYAVHIKDDHWTVATNDGSFAAHFEHTILITDSGCEILTA